MTHWQLEARFLFIKVGSDTLELVWDPITCRNTVTCMHLCNPFLDQAFIYFYAKKITMHTFFCVMHLCVCVCVSVCAHARVPVCVIQFLSRQY